VVEPTHLKNIRQIGSSPQVGAKIKIFETTTLIIMEVWFRSFSFLFMGDLSVGEPAVHLFRV